MRPSRVIYAGSAWLPPDGWCVFDDFPPADCTWCGQPTVLLTGDVFACIDCDGLEQIPYARPL